MEDSYPYGREVGNNDHMVVSFHMFLHKLDMDQRRKSNQVESVWLSVFHKGKLKSTK